MKTSKERVEELNELIKDDGRAFIVGDKPCNLRDKPARVGNVVGVLRPGTELMFKDVHVAPFIGEKWLEVCTAAGAHGYVLSTLVKRSM